MRICFYFVLFFIAKSLNFCCEECCVDCCCDWWNIFWEDCYKKSNKEEEENNKEEEENNKEEKGSNKEEKGSNKEEKGSNKEEKESYKEGKGSNKQEYISFGRKKINSNFFNNYREGLKDYIEAQKRMNLQNIEEIEKQKEEIEKQKEELKNKIREYLSHIENDVEIIKRNIAGANSVKEETLTQITKINKLINNFHDNEYFDRNSIENIRKDLKELQILCREAKIITFDDFYKKNEEWKKFLEDNHIQEKYEEKKDITPENFSLENTLEKLKNNFGTYLLEIFKARLYPIDKNGDEYKKEFMKFYGNYEIAIWISSLIEDSFKLFYEEICKMTSNGLDENINKECHKLLLTDNYLGFALLSDGDEDNILNVFCDKINYYYNMKAALIGRFIDSFKRNITEAIKKSINQNLEIENNLQKNNSENIKKNALDKYYDAIKDLNGEKIELTFFGNGNEKIGTNSFFKGCNLSVLFDYVLSKGREFYYRDGEEEDLGYVSYENEKGKLELKTALTWGGKSLNNAINEKQDITIGEFYENQIPNVLMLFKS